MRLRVELVTALTGHCLSGWISSSRPSHSQVTTPKQPAGGSGALTRPADVFVAKAVKAAEMWVPNSAAEGLQQAALPWALLQYQEETFLRLLPCRAPSLMQQQPPSKAPSGSRAVSAADRHSLVTVLAASIEHLDMQQLAGVARNLVTGSGVGGQASTNPSNVQRLWLFRAWLLQHQLLDGRGLTGLVTE